MKSTARICFNVVLNLGLVGEGVAVYGLIGGVRMPHGFGHWSLLAGCIVAIFMAFQVLCVGLYRVMHGGKLGRV